MITDTQLHEWYIADLQKEERWKDGTYHVKAKNIQAWKRIPLSKINNPDGPIDISNEIANGRQVWFSSDHHFGHANIIKYCNRPFPDTTLMRECLIGNHNKVVNPEDIVIFGGDIAFLDHHHKVNDILARMEGYKILIIGNHDIQRDRYEHYAVDEMWLCKTFNVEDLNFVVTHYPFNSVPEERMWDTLNIHGHTHDNPSNEDHQINICVEHHNYSPVSLWDLIPIAKTRLAMMAGVYQ